MNREQLHKEKLISRFKSLLPNIGMGGLPQKPDGPPPRKRGRGGMIGGWGVGRGGGGIMPMDRDPSPGTDDRDYRLILVVV